MNTVSDVTINSSLRPTPTQADTAPVMPRSTKSARTKDKMGAQA